MAKLGSEPKFTVLVFMLIASFASQPVAWAGEYRGTSEQQASCTPDAFRLCGAYIPDAGKVEACLRQRKSDLSASCRSVFDPGRAASSAR